MTPVLLPVKELRSTKSRLAADLPREAVEQITLAMLQDLVDCMRAVPEIDRIFVVTPDAELAATAEAYGAETLLLSVPGLNASLDAATRKLCELGAERLLITLGDVAGALPEEVSSLFRTLEDLGGEGVVLAPSDDGGSSALLRAPADALANHFGKDSASVHRELAKAAALPYAERVLPSLSVDLDRLSDVPALLATPGAPRTKQALRALNLGESS